MVERLLCKGDGAMSGQEDEFIDGSGEERGRDGQDFTTYHNFTLALNLFVVFFFLCIMLQ